MGFVAVKKDKGTGADRLFLILIIYCEGSAADIYQ